MRKEEMMKKQSWSSSPFRERVNGVALMFVKETNEAKF
jgi:hypothetical protein